MEVVGENLVKIEKQAEMVAVPHTIRYIIEYAGFNGSLTSLQLENTKILKIGNYAFSDCRYIHDISFPSSLNEIGEGAFNNCKQLRKISFPPDSSLLKIGDYAFQYCFVLKSFEFPPFLEFIGKYAFDSNLNFDLSKTKIRHLGKISARADHKLIILPSSLPANDIINQCNYPLFIDDSHRLVKRDKCGYYHSNVTIFECSKEKKYILIRNCVEIIAENSFSESKLVSITIPASVKIIANNAFRSCRKLLFVHFHKDSRLEEIGYSAFFNCYGLTKLNFPKSLKIIRKNAFYKCINVEKVIFPFDSQLERIEDAFNSKKIRSLALPPSLKEIDSIEFPKNTRVFISGKYFESNIDGTKIYSKDGSELVFVAKKTKRRFKIPDCIRVIKKGAFNFTKIIEKLVIPASVEVIEDYAFVSCVKLRIIEFATGSKLKSLGYNALHLFHLEKLIINNENFTTREDGIVISLKPRGIIFVPGRITDVMIDPGTEIIYGSAFKRSKIKRIMFPKSIRMICDSAFFDIKLESIEFEEGSELESIECHAFNGFCSCTNIERFKVPLIRKEISYKAFAHKFETIEFPPNFAPEFTDNESFYHCTIEKIICPMSSLKTVAQLMLYNEVEFEVIEHQ